MGHDDKDPAPASAGQFKTTHWSVVLNAKASNSSVADFAMERLCQTYWYPLYAFVRRQGHDPADAQDLTQGFFARFLEKNYLDDVSRSKGKFRSFLLASLKHYLANEWDKAQAQKRGGGFDFVPLEFDSAEAKYHNEPIDELTADKIFDRRWALTVLDRVLSNLRQLYVKDGKAELFSRLKTTLSGNKAAAPYAEIAKQLHMSEGAVKVAVHRLRQRYRDLLRAEVAHTVSSPDEIEEEIRHLLGSLSN